MESQQTDTKIGKHGKETHVGSANPLLCQQVSNVIGNPSVDGATYSADSGVVKANKYTTNADYSS